MLLVIVELACSSPDIFLFLHASIQTQLPIFLCSVYIWNSFIRIRTVRWFLLKLFWIIVVEDIWMEGWSTFYFCFGKLLCWKEENSCMTISWVISGSLMSNIWWNFRSDWRLVVSNKHLDIILIVLSQTNKITNIKETFTPIYSNS